MFEFLIRFLLFILYLVGGLGLCAVGGIALWARNWKLGGISVLLGLLGLNGAYEAALLHHPAWFVLLTIFFVCLVVVAILYITEPELGVIDRFKSVDTLLREGKKEKAALKLRKAKRYEEAARLYEELGWDSSALFCYEEAGNWEKVAELSLKLAEKETDDYYLRKARDIFEKNLNDLKRAVEVVERLAKTEGWYWEDAAELWEKIGDEDRLLNARRELLNYYLEEAKKEDGGVFWCDVAGVYEDLGEPEKAVEAYKEFLAYAQRMEEEERGRGWIRHVAETYYAIYRLTEDEEMKSKGDEAFERYKRYLEETILDEEYRKELMEKVKRWLKGKVSLKQELKGIE